VDDRGLGYGYRCNAPLSITFDDNVPGDFAKPGAVTDGLIVNGFVLMGKKIRPVCHGVYY